MVSQRKRARTLKPSKNPNQQKDNEETLDSGTGESSGYEQFRDQRIKENMQRMQKMGILDLSLKLKSELLPPKRSSRNPSDKTTPKFPLLPPSEPPRRSSRLKSVTPVHYAELNTKKKGETSKNEEINIREGSKPEIYTEEYDKLLGDCETGWTLFVDGYDENGKRVYDQVKGKTCHQCRQKTLGRHTHCIKCNLVQGQFCGDCLYMRYGENVIEANQNPSWICPVCRGICNCSLCRQAKGWAPTGSLYRKASLVCQVIKQSSPYLAFVFLPRGDDSIPSHCDMGLCGWVSRLGFKSVAHYLIQIRRSQPVSKDTGTENPVSPIESPPIANTGSEASLNNESLDEDEGPDGFPKPQPHNNKDNEMEEEEEVNDLKNKHIDINVAYNKDNDDDELKEEKEDDKGNQDLDDSKLKIGSKLYVEPAVTTKPVPNLQLED